MRRVTFTAVLAVGAFLAAGSRADAQYRPVTSQFGYYGGPVGSGYGNGYGVSVPYAQNYGYASPYTPPSPYSALYPNVNPYGYNPLSGTGARYPAPSASYPYGRYEVGAGYARPY